MPRLTVPLFKMRPTRKFNNYLPRTATYKVLLPPILADSVSNKKEKSNAAECLEEMSIMMTCWKEKDFSQQRCSKEIEAFQKCAVAAAEAASKKKQLKEKGLLTGEGGRLPSERVNKWLKRYPQPPHRYT